MTPYTTFDNNSFFAGLEHMLKRILTGFMVLCCVLQLTGCASRTSPDYQVDPLAPMNKTFFAFNRHVNKDVLFPIVRVYDFVVPSFVRTGIHNFYSNTLMISF